MWNELEEGGENCALAARYGEIRLCFYNAGSAILTCLKMPEFDDPERRLVICGGVSVRTSPARIIENFLDMSHFPFVHGGVLGAEPLTEVADYKVHVDENSGELWATECGFNQPQAMASSTGSADVDYRYRIPQPFSAVLVQVLSRKRHGEFDLVGIFPQPVDETDL